MIRRRTAAVAFSTAGILALGAFTLPTAQAEPVVPEKAIAAEWACLAVGEVDLGLCLDNPIPDISALPTVPETLADLLGSRR